MIGGEGEAGASDVSDGGVLDVSAPECAEGMSEELSPVVAVHGEEVEQAVVGAGVADDVEAEGVAGHVGDECHAPAVPGEGACRGLCGYMKGGPSVFPEGAPEGACVAEVCDVSCSEPGEPADDLGVESDAGDDDEGPAVGLSEVEGLREGVLEGGEEGVGARAETEGVGDEVFGTGGPDEEGGE